MKSVLVVIILAAGSGAFAQDKGNVIYQTSGQVTIAGAADRTPVVGAPYSATITNESVQTLADGNRIVQNSTGSTARDSQGRTRQEMQLPAIGNLSATNAASIVFVHDPVTQVSYTLNLTEKTAHKIQPPPAMRSLSAVGVGGEGGAAFAVRVDGNGPLPQIADAMPVTAGSFAGAGPFLEKHIMIEGKDQANTEDLGSQTMEGIVVNGTRMTRTIPAGQIGNEQAITIVTEVWTSPELKTVVYSKRTDPRMGEQTFRLTNIVRTEPSASLFTVPADFKIVDDPVPIIYRAKQ